MEISLYILGLPVMSKKHKNKHCKRFFSAENMAKSSGRILLSDHEITDGNNKLRGKLENILIFNIRGRANSEY